MTENLLLISTRPDEVLAQLNDISPAYKVLVEKDTTAALSLIEEKFNSDILGTADGLAAILVDTPSHHDRIREIFSVVELANNFIFSAPILILADRDRTESELEYLGGCVIDIIELPTSAIIFENRLRNSREQVNTVSFHEFSQMLKVLPANIYLKDARGRYVFSSQTWAHLDTGNDPGWTIRGKTDLDIRKDKENARVAMESDKKLFETGKGISYIIREHVGDQEYLQIIKEPLYFEDGRTRGIIALINDFTEQEHMRQELKKKSITDAMTGVLNRTSFDEFMESLSSNIPEVLTVFSADCDGLKIINDTYGHMIGDEYIRMCAALLRSWMPAGSTIFRTGGDEFVSFVPGMDEDQAKELITKMREDSQSFEVKGHSLEVSIGFSTLDNRQKDAGTSDREDRDMPDDIRLRFHLRCSDENMYIDKAKRKRERRSGIGD